MFISEFLLYFIIALALPYAATVAFLVHGFRKYISPWNRERVLNILRNVEILVAVDGMIFTIGLTFYVLQTLSPLGPGPTQNAANPSYFVSFYVLAWVPPLVLGFVLRFYPNMFHPSAPPPESDTGRLDDSVRMEITYREYERHGRQVFIILLVIGPLAAATGILSMINELPDTVLFSLFIIPAIEVMAILIFLIWIVFLVSNHFNRKKLKRL